MQAETLPRPSLETDRARISLRGVEQRFGQDNQEVRALAGVDLELRAGEFVAMVGESGCGKTTLLRLIAGLLQPSAGRVELDGCPIDGVAPEVAIVFQRPVLLDWRSVLDNVLLPAEIAGLPRAEYERRARGHRQFGREIAQFQAIRFKLADMAVSLDAARLLVGRAARLLDAGASAAACRRASAMAKLYATEAAQRIADEAVQIHGGLGVTRGHIVERIYREVRALRIYEGTSEIQRLVIAHAVIKDAGA